MTLPTYHKIPAPCPFCEKILDAATDASLNPESRPPREDDMTLCIYCGEWLFFTKDMTFRKPTEDEYVAIVQDAQYSVIRELWKESQKYEKKNEKDGYSGEQP
jgi:hypothetical protein